MPKSDTWPGGVAMQSASNLDSAGSCDSVISANSGYSQDSMEHLSPEERACLMYLEEMIEGLEVQEDSGLSNDEPDPPFQAGAGANDVSSLKSDASGKDETSPSESRAFFPEDQAEHRAPNQTSESPMSVTTQPKPPPPDFKKHPLASQLCVSQNGDGQLQIVPIVSLCPGPSDEASEIDVIPPPSDFMDEPDLPPSPTISDEPAATAVDLEQLRQRALAKRNTVSSSLPPNHPNQPRKRSLPALGSDLPTIAPPEPLRSPPAVYPKPKKLPANIILKSHKGTVTISEDNSEHPVPTLSERLSLDPQRVHVEALRKLGLLNADADSGPALSPVLSHKSRRSWTGPLSPISPRSPHTPNFTPPHPSAYRPPPASAAVSPAATSSARAVLPAPPDFGDSDNKPPADEDASDAAQVPTRPRTPTTLVQHLLSPKVAAVKSATLERSGLGLSDYIARQDSTDAAAASILLHRNRARPASLGSRKEFASAMREAPAGDRVASRLPEIRRSLPAQSGDSPKLPRSQGISVMICPRAENGGERREALKKLGLLRD
ncbi:Specifically androgen-regulated gene protein [Liparis tanakae]|uniref:Specifically androgen-regulated gene protein n=1 Tax=Liparis tanakae TaxID=230148 RepID=A0A4Z2I5Z4_9TELE|nr:Specifically androgen-regulated gene protein [Liparis tanakae]